MKKIISLALVISVSAFIPLFTMDRGRVGSNQKQRNENPSRQTESPTTPRSNLQQRKEHKKQQDLTRSQERHKKYSDDYNK